MRNAIDGGPDLEAIGYDAHFQQRLAALDGALTPARIAIAHGESYVAWTDRGACKAVLVGHHIVRWRQAIDRPQVGDWVAGTYSESAASLLVEHVLERRTCLMRLAAGERPTAQVIAANVDVVGIVSALHEGGGDARSRRLVNERRLQRYVTAVRQSGAQALLILNKSDLAADPAGTAAALGDVFPGVPVVLTSAVTTGGLDALGPWLGRGKTLGLVGMSGVGKSKLVNALLGRAAQRTGDVRAADARGRHTTTHRELLVMENGALLIDTPGMREFGLWEADDLAGFDDVLAIATACRFGDCRHATEPDCAIRAALDDGRLPPERWQNFVAQERKLAQQKFERPGVGGAGARGPARGGGRPHPSGKRRGR